MMCSQLFLWLIPPTPPETYTDDFSRSTETDRQHIFAAGYFFRLFKFWICAFIGTVICVPFISRMQIVKQFIKFFQLNSAECNWFWSILKVISVNICSVSCDMRQMKALKVAVRTRYTWWRCWFKNSKAEAANKKRDKIKRIYEEIWFMIRCVIGRLIWPETLYHFLDPVPYNRA